MLIKILVLLLGQINSQQLRQTSLLQQTDPTLYWFNSVPVGGEFVKDYGLSSHKYYTYDVININNIYVMAHDDINQSAQWSLELQDDGTYKFIFYDATDRWGSNGQCMNRLNDSAVLGLQTAGCDTFNIVKQTNGVYITKTNQFDGTTSYLSLWPDSSVLRDVNSYYVYFSSTTDFALWTTDFVPPETNEPDCDRQITYESVYGVPKPDETGATTEIEITV